MEWRDEGIVLSARPHGETSVVLELLTRRYGRHLGLVHGGRSRKMRPVVQAGNHVEASWKARISENLGHYSVELREGLAAKAMEDPGALAALSSMVSLLRLLAERDPHPNLFEVTLFVLSFLQEGDVWPALVVRWELALLDELGFGLDLTSCAATGSTEGLTYVSPKSGRAVSAVAGEAYKDRLLPLPQFLRNGGSASASLENVRAGLDLTGYFLNVRVLSPRGAELPDARNRLLRYLARKGVHAAPGL